MTPWRILLISDDRKIFDTYSPSQEEIIAYGKQAEEMYTIVCNTDKVSRPILSLAENNWIFATNSLSKIFYPLGIVDIARSQVTLKLRLRARIIVSKERLSLSLGAYALALLYGRKLFIDMEDEDFEGGSMRRTLKTKLKLELMRFILSRACGVRVLTKESQKLIESTIPKLRGKTHFLPAYFDAYNFSKTVAKREFDLHVRFPEYNIICLIKTKRFTDQEAEFAISVLSLLKQRYIKIGLVVVAPDSEYGPFIERARRSKVEDHVAFITDDTEMPSYYKTANVFWGVCRSEAIKSLREAAASGSPIVTLDIGVASSVVKDGESGFICTEENESLFMRKVIDTIEQPGLRERMRIQGQANALEIWNKDHDTYTKEIQAIWYKALQEE